MADLRVKKLAQILGKYRKFHGFHTEKYLYQLYPNRYICIEKETKSGVS